MRKSLKSRALYSLRIALGLVPWIAAMFGFYWLDASGTWTPDTPHRGKMSVALLATGMILSFLAVSRLTRR